MTLIQREKASKKCFSLPDVHTLTSSDGGLIEPTTQGGGK